jgi:lipopolysaccharide cholinephosphotransferase
LKELTLREIQLGELNVLKKLTSVCDELGLRYILYFGTLIGAVRHKGFIPWDDDVDVVMPRPDYEKLVAYFAEHAEEHKPFVLMHYKLNKDYIYPLARLCDTRYYVDYEGAKEYGLGLFVDIYPIDGCGQTKEEAVQYLLGNLRAVKMISLAAADRFKPSLQGKLATIPKFAAYCIAKTIGSYNLIRKLEEKAKKKPFDENKFVGMAVWDVAEKVVMEQDSFNHRIYLQFEDASFAVPENYDEILRWIYGDYMQLPPESERIGHHYYHAYLKDSDSI